MNAEDYHDIKNDFLLVVTKNTSITVSARQGPTPPMSVKNIVASATHLHLKIQIKK